MPNYYVVAVVLLSELIFGRCLIPKIHSTRPRLRIEDSTGDFHYRLAIVFMPLLEPRR